MGSRLLSIGAAAALACGALACSSSETSVTAPTTDNKCQVTATLSPTSFNATGGSGTVTISAARDCTWSVASNASWVSLANTHSGQGDASVAYTVSSNPAPSPRSGSIAVADTKLQLSQEGAPCRFALSRTQDVIDAAGGALSVAVSTLSGCTWNATPAVAWIAISSGASGNANGTVALAVAPNAGGERVGQVNVAGQIYTVTQAAAAPTPVPPTPGPDPMPPPPPPGDNTVQVSGDVSGLIGKCPNVMFGVSNRWITASDSTKYKDMRCNDLNKDNTRVTVTGTPTGAIGVDANLIEKIKHDH